MEDQAAHLLARSLTLSTKRHLCWFSCGGASAAAAKLTIDKYGAAAEVVYCDTMKTEHPDNKRFFNDVQRWIGREIVVIRSSKYEDIDQVFTKRRYMSGRNGAICTTEMKKIPRLSYQRESDTHVFGFTADKKELKRALEFEERNKDLVIENILIDAGMTKSDCHDMIKRAGIELPAMYALGFDHNNCIGCAKATSAGYWNLTRQHFPEDFARRAKQSRQIGARLVRVRLPGDPPSMDPPRHFLDELPEDATGPAEDIECGPACQMPAGDYDNFSDPFYPGLL